MSGSQKPTTCAGFLLCGATHNLGFRLAVATGRIDANQARETVPLHPSYRAMAEANGVVPSLKIGDADFKPATLTWEMVLVIGFVGGFLERLVPDLLEKKNSQSNAGDGTAGAGAHG